jgi:hypothetical protein
MKSVNACFISYRHTGDPEADKFVQAFYAQLKKQIAIYMPGVPIFFDEKGLKVGDKFNEELAFQLCRSACMVLIYSPLYFDHNYPYCALEYQAMLDLEKRRLNSVTEDLRNKGLIFPVVIRGLEDLPNEIKSQRQFEKFDHIVHESQFEELECLKCLNALAQEIWKCYRELHNANVFQCDCSKFCLPDKSSITEWLETVAPLRRCKMPGH